MTKKNTNGFLGWNAPHIHLTADQVTTMAAQADEWETVTEVINGCRTTFTRRVAK